MLETSIKVNTSQVLPWLSKMEKKQFPFVAAVTLTKIAKAAQEQEKKELISRFTLRSRKRILAGVRIKPAKKKDFKSGRMYSEVKDIDEFMGIHTTGGIKKPTRNRLLAVPTEDYQDEGIRTSTGKIKKSKAPASLFSKIKMPPRKRKVGRHKKPRPHIYKNAKNQLIIAQRLGPARTPRKFLYFFPKKAPIKKRWPFVDIAENVATLNYSKIFKREMAKAIR